MLAMIYSNHVSLASWINMVHHIYVSRELNVRYSLIRGHNLDRAGRLRVVRSL